MFILPIQVDCSLYSSRLLFSSFDGLDIMNWGTFKNLPGLLRGRKWSHWKRALMVARQDDNIWEGHQFQFMKCNIWPFERKWKKKIAACKTRYAQTSFLRAWWFTTTPKRPARKHQLVALQNLIPAHYLKLQTLAKGPPKMTMSTNSQVDKPGCVPLCLSSNNFFLNGTFS
jgi:hypothetical protein